MNMKYCNSPNDVRKGTLARVYLTILAWEPPEKKHEEPVAENLGRDTATGPTPETSTLVDSTPSTSSAQAKAGELSQRITRNKRGLR
jgi:hypothetical protein